MIDFIEAQLIDFVFSCSGVWLYITLFVTTALESIPPIGIIIPGQIIVLLSGFLITQDILKLFPTIFIASVAAIVGDCIAYIIGRYYGESFLFKYGKKIAIKEEWIQSTRILAQKHPGKSLVIGRFNSFTRSIAPFLIGASHVPLYTFFLWNIIGGVLWAITFVLLGYFFGESYEVIARFTGHFALAVLLVIVISIYLYKIFFRKRSPDDSLPPLQ